MLIVGLTGSLFSTPTPPSMISIEARPFRSSNLRSQAPLKMKRLTDKNSAPRCSPIRLDLANKNPSSTP